jgi:segregation and condensation protein B
MDYFGINSADDLPKIKEVLAEQAVEATYLNKNANTEQEPGEQERPADVLIEEDGVEFLAVAPNGELVTAVEEENTSAPESPDNQPDNDENGEAANENGAKGNPEE